MNELDKDRRERLAEAQAALENDRIQAEVLFRKRRDVILASYGKDKCPNCGKAPDQVNEEEREAHCSRCDRDIYW